MTILQALILGTLQGITEFLPISSSGHLIFVPHVFGWGDQGITFDVIVHLGSLVAVVAYFRSSLWRIISSFWSRGINSKMNRTLGLLLVLSVIPAGLVGLFASDYIESTVRSATVVAYGLIVWGIVLYIAERYSKHLEKNKKNLTEVTEMSWQQVAVISVAQAIALIPGTSRSGITMTTGLFSKLSKKAAAEFSFLMSVPVISIAGALKVLQFVKAGGESIALEPLVIGFLAAAFSGYLAIWGLMKIIEKWSFVPFVVYRVVVGILILVFLV
jgi:undecaprenyl-diphosphatase